MHIPFIRPNPPKLSGLADELAAIEASGVFSNHGPVNTRLEHDFRSLVFGTGAAWACATPPSASCWPCDTPPAGPPGRAATR